MSNEPLLEVRKEAKIRNRYNQVPHLTRDSTCKSDKNTIKHHNTNLTLNSNVDQDPSIPIPSDMVKKDISKMNSGKAAGPSCIVVEIIKATGDTGATMSLGAGSPKLTFDS